MQPLILTRMKDRVEGDEVVGRESQEWLNEKDVLKKKKMVRNYSLLSNSSIRSTMWIESIVESIVHLLNHHPIDSVACGYCCCCSWLDHRSYLIDASHR